MKCELLIIISLLLTPCLVFITSSEESIIAASIQLCPYSRDSDNETYYEFISPVEDEFIKGDHLFRIMVHDDDGISQVRMIFRGETHSAVYIIETGYYQVFINTNLVGDGQYNLRWNISDEIGNYTDTILLNFNIDNHPPTINIASPTAGQVIRDLFFFDVENNDLFKKNTEYRIDKTDWHTISIGWNTRLLKDGNHNISIRGSDHIGHVTMMEYSVIVDNNAPEIEFITPVYDEFIEGVYIFRLAAQDEVGISGAVIKIANKEETLWFNKQTGYYEFSMDTTSLLDGEYIVNATVTDISRREVKTDDISFKIDNSVPMILVEAPTHNQVLKGVTVIRAISVDEFPGLLRYSIDGNMWCDVTSPWNTTNIGDGAHTVTIRAEDQAGHYKELHINITVDNNSPIITQKTLIPGMIIRDIQNLEFYVNDSVGIDKVTIRIDDAVPFEIYQGDDGILFDYLLNTRMLSDGHHTLTLEAYDRAGNVVSSTFGVEVDNSGPKISLDHFWLVEDMEVHIGTVEEGISVNFEVTTTDASGIEEVMINIDSTEWKEMVPDPNESNPDSYIYIWSTTDDDAGNHTYQIRSVDKLGNEIITSGIIEVEEKDEESDDLQTLLLSSVFLILLIIALVVVLFIVLIIGLISFGIVYLVRRKKRNSVGEFEIDDEDDIEEEEIDEDKIKSEYEQIYGPISDSE